MENFDASQARSLADSMQGEELNEMLSDIKQAAQNGEYVLYTYKPIKSITKDKLRERGFDVTDHPSIAIQKDGLYYTIRW